MDFRSHLTTVWKLLFLVFFKGRSINTKSAGIIGRTGPQSKQPFLVAFFKASGVLLRSVRAAGGKKKNHNRNKSTNQQESSRVPKSGGKRECNGCSGADSLTMREVVFFLPLRSSIGLNGPQQRYINKLGFFWPEVQISKKKIYIWCYY